MDDVNSVGQVDCPDNCLMDGYETLYKLLVLGH